MEKIRGDERLRFYEAMLTSNSYEAYEAVVGRTEALVESRKDSSFTGHQEILYARTQGWIEDEGSVLI